MIYQRATLALREAGIDDIVICKLLYGASPQHLRWERQTSQCFRTPAEAVLAVLAGFRPIRLPSEEG
mgnify:FL=1